MVQQWTTEILAWFSCVANGTLVWIVPLNWIGTMANMSGPAIAVLPKTKGRVLRAFKIFRSKRI